MKALLREITSKSGIPRQIGGQVSSDAVGDILLFGSLLKLEKGSTTIDSRGAGVSRRRGALPPVDNGGQHGAPVIYEDNPTHQTLEQLLTLASTVSLQPEPVELRRSRCFVARLRHPARGLVQALALIEGAVPLSSTFDAQALDRTALQFEAVKRSLCFAW